MTDAADHDLRGDRQVILDHRVMVDFVVTAHGNVTPDVTDGWIAIILESERFSSHEEPGNVAAFELMSMIR